MSTFDLPQRWPREVPPTYCGRCGQMLMDQTVEATPADAFDVYTGQRNPPTMTLVRRCPSWKPMDTASTGAAIVHANWRLYP